MKLYRGNKLLLWLYALTNDLTAALLTSASSTSSRLLDADGNAISGITPAVTYSGASGHWYATITKTESNLLTLDSTGFWEVVIDFGGGLEFTRQEPFVVKRPYDGQ